MCDYSLIELSNRLARLGEDLVIHRFRTGTMGLMSPSEQRPVIVPRGGRFWATVKNLFSFPSTKPVCAVCIPPGAQLLLREIPDSLQQELKIDSTECVKFTQVSAQVGTHRDAVMFANGRTVLLQRLNEGQPVQVLSLSSHDGVNSLRSRFAEAESKSAAMEV